MAETTAVTKHHCKQHKMCAGCPLVGECVAPTGNDPLQFARWVESMNVKIAALYAPEVEQQNKGIEIA